MFNRNAFILFSIPHKKHSKVHPSTKSVNKNKLKENLCKKTEIEEI